MASLLSDFAQRKLNHESEIEEGEQVRNAAVCILCSSTRAVKKRQRKVWKMLEGTSPIPLFPYLIKLYIV